MRPFNPQTKTGLFLPAQKERIGNGGEEVNFFVSRGG